MIFYKDNRNQSSCTRLRLSVGDKLCSYDNTYESTKELAVELNAFGVNTRIAQNMESKLWSIAILDIPDESVYLKFNECGYEVTND